MSKDPEEIAGWQRLHAWATTSGRLQDGDIARLAELGVRHVINLALPDSPGALPDEGEELARHGIRYTHIPVPFDAPEESHYAAFLEALENSDRPCHVHCIMNWRVSAFFYRYHCENGMMSPEAARILMEVQWSPETSDSPHASAWVRFIAARD